MYYLDWLYYLCLRFIVLLVLIVLILIVLLVPPHHCITRIYCIVLDYLCIYFIVLYCLCIAYIACITCAYALWTVGHWIWHCWLNCFQDVCDMYRNLFTCSSKSYKIYAMNQFHNISDSRVKGTRGVTLSYIWADIPDMHCRRPSVARELVNPMFFFNVYGLIASGQKWPTFSDGGGAQWTKKGLYVEIAIFSI